MRRILTTLAPALVLALALAMLTSCAARQDFESAEARRLSDEMDQWLELIREDLRVARKERVEALELQTACMRGFRETWEPVYLSAGLTAQEARGVLDGGIAQLEAVERDLREAREDLAQRGGAGYDEARAAMSRIRPEMDDAYAVVESGRTMVRLARDLKEHAKELSIGVKPFI